MGFAQHDLGWWKIVWASLLSAGQWDGVRIKTAFNNQYFQSLTANYNKEPVVRIQGHEQDCFSGWPAIIREIRTKLLPGSGLKNILIVECYQGILDAELLVHLQEGLDPSLIIQTKELMWPADKIREITYQDVTDDRIFGFMTRLTMSEFLDPFIVAAAKEKINSMDEGLILVYGPGASLVSPESGLIVYADMARWEIQLRMRRNEVSNLGLENASDRFETQYKTGFFVDWRVCDKLKKQVMPYCDYILDTNRKEKPGMITAKAFREAMEQAVRQPFSVVPYFDAGPWGGQWMKQHFGLDPALENYAWCFNCVPEENSLLLDFGGFIFETPAINLVFSQARQLLGDPVHARFGDEFPIRFDYLDTMEGGNLSLQVHPLTEYIQEHFGMHYTQDESYYMLEAGEGARVYLGLKDDVNPAGMAEELYRSEQTGRFDDSKFVESWPAKKHDHFLIPGGTVHCSGKDCMVLEISATPYIFTFKLWDWGRLGMDGKPRPINIRHGLANIQWDRSRSWVGHQLVNQVQLTGAGDGWTEERTGLHDREFIETRRHWFTKQVLHHTHNGVNVLALVEGNEAIVESPSGAFEPFVVHYAEVFIVPAAVGEYTIRPFGGSEGKQCATIKAYVRTNP